MSHPNQEPALFFVIFEEVRQNQRVSFLIEFFKLILWIMFRSRPFVYFCYFHVIKMNKNFWNNWDTFWILWEVLVEYCFMLITFWWVWISALQYRLYCILLFSFILWVIRCDWIKEIIYLSCLGLSYFLMKTAGACVFYLSLSCMVWYFLKIKSFL